MNRTRLILIALALLAATLVFADHRTNSFRAILDGYQEVPAVSSTGSGRFVMRIVDEDTIDYTLIYNDLEGTTTTASHVHLGQKDVNGGVMFFICGGGGRPDCTPTSGRYSGSVTAADILGPAGQGIAEREFEEVLRAIREGAAYVNVHTNKHPGGEIRGQIIGQGHSLDHGDN